MDRSRSRLVSSRAPLVRTGLIVPPSYLLSPQTSPIGGIGNPSARVVLLGSRSPQTWSGFTRDSDPIIFTEILEFALSLVTPAKGQESFNGFPHLQAYRFMRAMALAELGHVQEANRFVYLPDTVPNVELDFFQVL